MDTLPVQDLVDYTKQLEKKGLKAFILVKIAALTGPLAGIMGWFVTTFLDRFVEWIVEQAIEYVWKLKFRANIDLITSDQGADYRKDAAAAIRAQRDPSIPVSEWEKRERAANHSLNQLGNYTK